MSRHEKLLERLLSRPNDFTFTELLTLLKHFGYTQCAPGTTGGSRVMFTDEHNNVIRLHKPHPRNILKRYQIDDIVAALKEGGHIQ